LSKYPYETNPNCQVEYEELSTIKGPEVYVDFEDGRKLVWFEIFEII
jgi:hypothetical protein